MVLLAAAVPLLLFPAGAQAQSSACTGNEDVVTFDFAAAAARTTAGTSATWADGTLANTYAIATAASVNSNTIAFTITANPAAPFVNPDPSQVQQGNINESLSLNMNPSAAGQGVTMTLVFNRPMDKVRFNMLDVDRSGTNWQDRMRVAGYLNSTATLIPVLVPVTPGNFTTASVAEFNQITSNVDNNCAATDASCNVRVDFANPVDSIVVVFEAGPAIAAPTTQRVAFNDFSYCVPKRDLRVLKGASLTPFVGGNTATYTLTINNRGNAATNGNTTITDVISTQGVSFVTPQTPTNWTCVFSATTFANDTANCIRGTAIAATATVVLTLTVSISPDVTATTAVNRAKVYGGGDPNKLTLTATGPVANCSATNENQSGGGAFYFGGVDTTDAGCSFESTPLSKRAQLTIAKTNNGTTLTAGLTTTYTVIFANFGPSNASGATLLDPVATGLNCTTVTFSSTPAGTLTTSPSPLTISALQSTGISLTPTFPPNTTANFVVTCGVTASGT